MGKILSKCLKYCCGNWYYFRENFVDAIFEYLPFAVCLFKKKFTIKIFQANDRV